MLRGNLVCIQCDGNWITVLSFGLLLVFSGLKCLISVTQSLKYTRLKRITNQFSFVYIVAKSLYIQDTLTAHSLLLLFCASFMPRLANTGDIDIPNLWVSSTSPSYLFVIYTISTCEHWPYVCFCSKIDCDQKGDQMSGWTKKETKCLVGPKRDENVWLGYEPKPPPKVTATITN